MLKIKLFGVPTLLRQENGLVKTITHTIAIRGLALFSYLAVTQIPHERSILADLLWTDISEKKAKENFRYVLYDLKKILGDYLIVTRRTVALNQSVPYWLDVEAFSTHLKYQKCADDLSLFRDALDLYQNEFLAGFHVKNAPVFEEWMMKQQRNYEHDFIQGLQNYIVSSVECSDYSTGIKASRQLLALQPWNEEVHYQHMLLLAYSGQRSAALTQYHTCCKFMKQEYGADPLPETTLLYEQIKANTLLSVEGWPSITSLPSTVLA